jgi:glutamate-ammonia-ligase adenylyltransferase
MAVIAMGRLGGHEMAYASDADVLFVHDPMPGADERVASDAAHAVANELRRLLGLPGPDPSMQVDAALRPEGRQGPLVRTISSYAAYYARWSKVWEAQALLRCEPIAGDAELGQRFVDLIDPLRYPAGGLTDEQVTEVRRIKARVDAERLPRGADPATHVKLGRGGLADIEWTMQLLQLRYAAERPALQTTKTLAAMQAAVDVGVLEQEDKDVLREAWRLASRIRNATMLVRARPSDSLPVQPRDRAGVAYVCGYPIGESSRLTDDYLRVSRRANSVVDKIFWS